MMNKKLTLLLLVCVIALSACGPKRYGCGPRRCEVKMEHSSIPITQKLNAAFV